jgi:DNA replication protein DnaC
LSTPILSYIQGLKQDTVDKCEKCGKIGWIAEGQMCECLKKVQYNYRLLCSNIPDTYRSVSFDQFVKKTDKGFIEVKNYCKKIMEMRSNGLGLHLYNENVGVGKTLLGVCVLLEAIKNDQWVWFTSMSRLLEDIRKGFDDKDWRKTIEWALFNTDFLMIDELEKFNNTESGWLTDRLNDLIQTRINYMRPLITTGNVSLGKISDKYQKHLISRFHSRQIELLVGGTTDFRMEIQKQEKEKLLKGKK